jgi:hypothetical protein
MSAKVTFVGSGDAFGSGGRFNTCILVDVPGVRFALDFGASSLKRWASTTTRLTRLSARTFMETIAEGFRSSCWTPCSARSGSGQW